jgi:hypothetical protein
MHPMFDTPTKRGQSAFEVFATDDKPIDPELQVSHLLHFMNISDPRSQQILHHVMRSGTDAAGVIEQNRYSMYHHLRNHMIGQGKNPDLPMRGFVSTWFCKFCFLPWSEYCARKDLRAEADRLLMIYYWTALRAAMQVVKHKLH